MGDDSFYSFKYSKPDISGYQVVLCAPDGSLEAAWLPLQPVGYYRFSSKAVAGILSLQVIGDRWHACCGNRAFFQNVPPDQALQAPLTGHRKLVVERDGESATLYADALTDAGCIFTKYTAASDFSTYIGSSSKCGICIPNSFLEPQHAVLRYEGGKWSIQSVRGSEIYVNQTPVQDRPLRLGDTVFLAGCRMVVGTNFLSIHCGGRDIQTDQCLRKETGEAKGGHFRRYDTSEAAHTERLFSRMPRKHLVFEEPVIQLEAPPVAMNNSQIPLLLRMGGSMVMSGRAALSGNFMSLITSVLFPFMSSKYTDRQRQEYEQRRVEKYQAYLSKKEKDILAACQEERNYLLQKYPPVSDMTDAGSFTQTLWERRPMDDDFLVLRLGSGRGDSHVTVDYPPKGFDLDTDVLEEKMLRLAEKKRTLDNIPILFSLVEDYITGIAGDRQRVRELLHRLILQIALRHSYDEVKMVFFLEEEDLEEFSYLRYLPHCWSNGKTLRFLASNEADAYKISEYFNTQLPEELGEEDLRKTLKSRPYYAVFSFSKSLFDKAEIFKKVLLADCNQGISIITVNSDPLKETKALITLDAGSAGRLTSLRDSRIPDAQFTLDALGQKPVQSSLSRVANTALITAEAAFDLPKTVTFLEMLQAGRIEHLDVARRWRENNPTVSLSAPVGISADGTLFTLDLHEKKQGPHGLVAGMTGSGKSEFIITYILSMAVNYSPDEVAFILIDYKGGGLAGAFENPQTGVRLPHLAGTITNLDGGAIQRSLMSIESELKRRQRIFNEVKNATGDGTMDIYAYQKLYRAKKVSDPLPHLFIISDEFAELKQQQPEFMEKLISAARIGRSLGVHLILATQKPAGVVNDQIRSNTKFRVCLRVQDRADSMDMLKRPEAAELTDTGRFYLQVGYNEFFALGQSAWCGAEYEPQDTVQIKRDDAVEFIDGLGTVVAKAKPKVRKTRSGVKQLVAVVKYLSDLAEKENCHARLLWQPPLPQVLPLEELWQKTPRIDTAPIRAVVGIADDPENQDQFPLVLELQNCQNMLVVGEAGSGKTTLLQTLLYSLVSAYTPEQLNYYILDFSNKRLMPFRSLPHCGGYLSEEDERDHERLLKFLSQEIASRKKLFEQAEVSSYEDYCLTHKLPLILVIINNIVGMSATKAGQNLAYTLNEYLREGAAFGVQYIITASHANQLTAKAKQELGARLALRAKDRYDYAEILGKKVVNVPGDTLGRGMCLHQERPLEMMVAAIKPTATSSERAGWLRARLKEIADRYPAGPRAREMVTVRPEEEYRTFADRFPLGRIPLGYSLEQVQAVAMPLKQLYRMSLYFGNPDGVQPVLDNVLYAARRENMEVILVTKQKESRLAGKDSLPGVSTLCCGDAVVLQRRIAAEIEGRKRFRNEYCERMGISPQDPGAQLRASDYIRSKTRGLLVLFESASEFFLSLGDQPQVHGFFISMFRLGMGMNIYFLGCFQPDEPDSLLVSDSYKAFIKEQHVLLFGGRFDRQNLVNLPMEYRSVKDVSKQYNRFLMHYRDKTYPMLMPCGPLTLNEDEDLKSII